MPVQFYGGSVLFVAGQVAMDANCCCDDCTSLTLVSWDVVDNGTPSDQCAPFDGTFTHDGTSLPANTYTREVTFSDPPILCDPLNTTGMLITFSLSGSVGIYRGGVWVKSVRYTLTVTATGVDVELVWMQGQAVKIDGDPTCYESEHEKTQTFSLTSCEGPESFTIDFEIYNSAFGNGSGTSVIGTCNFDLSVNYS